MQILFNCPPSTASYHPLASPPHLTLLLYSVVRLMIVEKLLSAAFIDTFIQQQSSFDPALPLVTWELILASFVFLPGSVIMGIYITGLQSKGEEKGMFMCGLWRDLIKQWSSFQNTRLSRKKQHLTDISAVLIQIYQNEYWLLPQSLLWWLFLLLAALFGHIWINWAFFPFAFGAPGCMGSTVDTEAAQLHGHNIFSHLETKVSTKLWD